VQLLIWSLVFIFVNAAFVRLFESTNKQVIVTKITGLMVIVNVAINLVLIPKFSYVGASIAILLTESIALVLLFFLAERELYVLKKTELASVVLKIIGASVVMGLFVAYFHTLNLFLVIVLASMLYFGTLYVVKGIEKEDIILQVRAGTRKTE